MKTPISYYGGKQTMLKHIMPLIPAHTLYTEAFCGGCSVFFAKEPVKCEVINDTNRELINFFQVAKAHYMDLKVLIDATIHSRDTHAHALHIGKFPSFFTPVERAWSVWVCSKMGFASKLNGTFGYDRVGTTRLKVINSRDSITQELCDRLQHATIESEDGLSIIRRYDTESAFHFVDPPYVGSNCGHYSGSFNEQNLRELLDLLSTVKGKFMLTMFPNDDIADFAARFGWSIVKVERTISASINSRRRQQEWIVMNYTL